MELPEGINEIKTHSLLDTYIAHSCEGGKAWGPGAPEKIFLGERGKGLTWTQKAVVGVGVCKTEQVYWKGAQVGNHTVHPSGATVLHRMCCRNGGSQEHGHQVDQEFGV